MRSKIKLPTILGLIILVIGTLAGIFLINSEQEFRLGADISYQPQDVRVTNIGDKTVTITWTTQRETEGFIKWGTSQRTLNKIVIEDGGGTSSLVHSATILDADPNTTIYFKINSGGTDYDNNGIPWQAQTKTQTVKSLNQIFASGSIFDSSGQSSVQALIYLTINGEQFSAKTSSEGNFILPLSQYLNISDVNTLAELNVNAGNIGNSSAVIHIKNLKNIPAIILGKSYDFRSIETIDTTTLPESKINSPEYVERSSRFEVSRSNTQPSLNNVSVESIEDGEIILTTEPEFFGLAPAGTKIEVIVESEMQSANISAGSSGRWSWSPPNNLEPGEHKLTIKWIDASGITKTITRTFYVQAAEGPAFVSTPSATLTPTATATATATTIASSLPTNSATPTSLATTSATPSPTPETGGLTPSLLMFISGLVIFVIGYIYNKNAI